VACRWTIGRRDVRRAETGTGGGDGRRGRSSGSSSRALDEPRSTQHNRRTPIFFRGTRRELEERERDLAEPRWTVERLRERTNKERAAIDKKETRLQMLITSRVDAYPHIAQAWADWELAVAQKEVAAKGREMAELRRELKLTQYNPLRRLDVRPLHSPS
jgi:hypothetical protein